MSALTERISPTERRRAREFAQLLEHPRPGAGHELESLVALTASLRPAQLAPRREFRAALRESLVAEASARPVLAPSPASPPRRRHRLRTVVATAVLVSLVGGAGAAAASTHALPGDALYGLKRGIESAQLHLARSDLSRGREHLDQADHRLSEAEALAGSEDARSAGTTARIAAAIADLTVSTRAGVLAFDASYADTGDVETMRELDRFIVDQRERLAELSRLLSPDLQILLSPLSDQPLTGPGADATRRVIGLLGGDPSTTGPTGGAGGGPGSGAVASMMPSAVPQVSLPASPVPSVPLPSAPVPKPSITLTLPVDVTPPTCLPIPPLTSC